MGLRISIKAEAEKTVAKRRVFLGGKWLQGAMNGINNGPTVLRQEQQIRVKWQQPSLFNNQQSGDANKQRSPLRSFVRKRCARVIYSR
jgi:hypothetical protein